MNETFDIDKTLSTIKNLDPIKYGEQILMALCEPATNYLDKLKEYNLLPIVPDLAETFSEKSPEQIQKCLAIVASMPFFIWINKQPGFKNAKKRLVEAKLVNCSFENTQPISVFSFTSQYYAEFIVANTISQYAQSIPNLRGVVFIPIEWKRLTEKYSDELTVISRNFELPSEEQLFLYLLKRLQNSKGNVFNSGRPHSMQARELFMKQIMRGLFYNFQIKQITDTLIADLALDIIGDFFDPMKRSNAIELATAIRENVEKEICFLQKKVIEILSAQS